MQKLRLAPAALGFGATLSAAHAGFVGAAWEMVEYEIAGETTYRLYAVFDDPADQLLAITGVAAGPPLVIATDTALVNHGGAFGGSIEEDFAGLPLTHVSDTWVAIGTSVFAGNDTNFTPGWRGACIGCRIGGSAWSEASEGWFDGNPGTPELPDAQGRILIAQLTVADHDCGAPARAALSGTATWLAAGRLVESAFAVTADDPCPADVVADGAIGIGDLVGVLSAWGPVVPPCDGACACRADVDGDGTVGLSDLLRVLSEWGTCRSDRRPPPKATFCPCA